MENKDKEKQEKTNEKVADVMKELCQEQMRLHPEIYSKNGEQ